MVIRLETFGEYTLDFRLKQIRKVNLETMEIEFIDFDSKKGKEIIKGIIKARTADMGVRRVYKFKFYKFNIRFINMNILKENMQKKRVTSIDINLIGHNCYRCSYEWLPQKRDLSLLSIRNVNRRIGTNQK